MATRLNTFAGRVILIGLVIHAVLLPLLFYGLLHIVKESHEELFINDAEANRMISRARRHPWRI